MYRKALLIVMLLSGGAAVAGAPFCVVSSFGKQCTYYDEPFCQRTANTLHGACVINTEEAKPPSNSGPPFCVVSSFGTQCTYYDAPACERAAEALHGRCAARD